MAASDDRPNEVQSRYWNEEGGPSWVGKERMYEQMLEPFDLALLDALGPTTGERVLDIGCGFGTTSLAVASRGARVRGVDISAPMIERARERAMTAGAGIEARFELGDAQTDDLGGPYDAVVSRFGVMFFSDPVQAFANIGASVVDGGRLAFVCWQPMECNPWMTLPADVVRALLDDGPASSPAPAASPAGAMPGPNPFAFGDAGFVQRILTDAGWTTIELASCEPVIALGAGDGVAGAVEQALNGSAVKALLATGDVTVRDRAAAILAERFAAHAADGTVRMPSAAWLVTARR